VLYVAQKGGTRGGPEPTWSRHPPVKFLSLVANEKRDFWRDDSSSYIQKREKQRKRNNKKEEKKFVLRFLEG